MTKRGNSKLDWNKVFTILGLVVPLLVILYMYRQGHEPVTENYRGKVPMLRVH